MLFKGLPPTFAYQKAFIHTSLWKIAPVLCSDCGQVTLRNSQDLFKQPFWILIEIRGSAALVTLCPLLHLILLFTWHCLKFHKSYISNWQRNSKWSAVYLSLWCAIWEECFHQPGVLGGRRQFNALHGKQMFFIHYASGKHSLCKFLRLNFIAASSPARRPAACIIKQACTCNQTLTVRVANTCVAKVQK